MERSGAQSGAHSGLVSWLFRDRRTGRIVVVQWPNLLLWAWLGTAVVRWVFAPTGAAGTALHVAGSAFLVAWAADEVIRGVNPFRRGLGVAVLAAQVASWWR